MPQISKEKIEKISLAITTGKDVHSVLDMLQGLLDQPEGETIGYAEHLRLAIAKVCEGFTLHDGARKILETALFTHPAPFTPITADMVTDEMDLEFIWSCPGDKRKRKAVIADAYNAVGKHMGAKK